MKVSIITVCYNSEEYIFDAIKSVNEQCYPDIEHIFIDGCSTDGTVRTIKNNAFRNASIISETDCGIYDAMNKGLSIASGDVIGFLNSDDFYIDTQVISDVVATFNSSSTNLVWGDLNYVYRNNTTKIFRSIRSSSIKSKDLALGIVPPHPTFFIRSAMLASKCLKFDLKYSLASDFDFMKRAIISENFNGVYLNKVLVQMRHGGATSNSIKNIIKQNLEIINSLSETFKGFSILKFVGCKIAKRTYEVVNSKIRNLL